MCYGLANRRVQSTRDPAVAGISASSAATRAPASGSRNDSVPTATRSAPACMKSSRDGRSGPRPSRRSGSRPARGPPRPARGRPRGPPGRTRRRCRHRATARRAARVRSAMPRSVLIERDGVGAVRLGGGGDLRRRRAVGRQLDDQRLARVRRGPRRAARAISPRVGADDQPGLDVRARDVELERRRPRRARRTPRPACATSLAREAHDVDDQRHRQLGELAAGPRRGSRRGPCSAARSS